MSSASGLPVDPLPSYVEAAAVFSAQRPCTARNRQIKRFCLNGLTTVGTPRGLPSLWQQEERRRETGRGRGEVSEQAVQDTPAPRNLTEATFSTETSRI
ncbi:hypothetical protein SKAU_G00118490 [Synaphobranchus kaupii]|uniref:Uncharacterized protein n=1 Tax=Synaphobranchus kaupii TaxID=118154 RepID=A0A9Q1J257_SYNKA|nr:hypothetical protein SKAU_G00118490 [Synaphobranchus kaupii]